MDEEQTKPEGNVMFPPSKLKGLLTAIIVVLVIVAAIMLINVLYNGIMSLVNPSSVVTSASIEKIISASDLSTYQATYNGIAHMNNASNPEKTDYYVSYEAKVNAGIEFDQIQVEVDKDANEVRVKLPEVQVFEPEVDITTMDYIFVDQKSETQTISEQAYKLCIADVEEECMDNQGVKTLAYQNAINTISALVEPFIAQMMSGYALIIE